MKKSVLKILLASILAIGTISTVYTVSASGQAKVKIPSKGMYANLKLDKEEQARLNKAGIKVNTDEIAKALLNGGDLSKYKLILDKDDLAEIEALAKKFNLTDSQKQELINIKIMDEFADDIAIYVDGVKQNIEDKFDDLDDKYGLDNDNDDLDDVNDDSDDDMDDLDDVNDDSDDDVDNLDDDKNDLDHDKDDLDDDSDDNDNDNDNDNNNND